jgi:hypothetical protein
MHSLLVASIGVMGVEEPAEEGLDVDNGKEQRLQT